jgi:alkanesulfonate monooxygenase SsuD/methylene tetrahydromethanopterin reductase-like flavin-dependent oxidoreductase (luciferase family)
MLGVNVISADTDAEASRLFTTVQQSFTNIVRGIRTQLPPPIDDMESYWLPHEKERVSGMLKCSFVGSPSTVEKGVVDFVKQTKADELLIASAIFDHSARLHSYELASELRADH